MEKPTDRSTTTAVLLILTGLIFFADLRFESGFATWLPYFFLAVPASRLYSRRVFLIAVGGWSLLIPAKLLVHIPTHDPTTGLFNHTLGIIGLWITAYLLYQHRQMGRLRAEDEERMRTMLDGALDAVITIDADSIVTTWNRQAEQTFAPTGALRPLDRQNEMVPVQRANSWGGTPGAIAALKMRAPSVCTAIR